MTTDQEMVAAQESRLADVREHVGRVPGQALPQSGPGITNRGAALTRELAKLREELGRYETITPEGLVTLFKGMLLTRLGEVLTAELAEERARNMAAAMQCLRVWP